MAKKEKQPDNLLTKKQEEQMCAEIDALAKKYKLEGVMFNGIRREKDGFNVFTCIRHLADTEIHKIGRNMMIHSMPPLMKQIMEGLKGISLGEIVAGKKLAAKAPAKSPKKK